MNSILEKQTECLTMNDLQCLFRRILQTTELSLCKQTVNLSLIKTLQPFCMWLNQKQNHSMSSYAINQQDCYV